MRQLRRRPRADKLENQKRKATSNVSRRVYLVMLIAFGLAMSNYFWGDLFIMRSDGVVLRDENVVAVTYLARVKEVKVREGQRVRKGDVIMQIESTEVLERLADLSVRGAELSQRAAELQLRSEVGVQLLPLAAKRESETDKVLVRLNNMSDIGLLTSARYEEALRSNFSAREQRVKLAVENETLKEQVSALANAREDAAMATKNLELHYSSGVIRAPVDGSIGASIPPVGKVYRAGDPMLSVLSGKAYVLAYLPNRYLFPIERGLKVSVHSGRNQDDGYIEDILPITQTLPLEFQNSFKPRDRSQLAKIRLTHPEKFPTFDKVKITLSYF